MTIRVDLTNMDDVPLYVETQSASGRKEVMVFKPGASGTVYVKKDAPILLRECLRAKDRYNPTEFARNRRVEGRRFGDRRG